MPPKQTISTDLQILLAIVTQVGFKRFPWGEIAKILKISPDTRNPAQAAYDRFNGLRRRHIENGSWPGAPPRVTRKRKVRLSTRSQKTGPIKAATQQKELPYPKSSFDDSEDDYMDMRGESDYEDFEADNAVLLPRAKRQKMLERDAGTSKEGNKKSGTESQEKSKSKAKKVGAKLTTRAIDVENLRYEEINTSESEVYYDSDVLGTDIDY
jgi:hypothetical protein